MGPIPPSAPLIVDRTDPVRSELRPVVEPLVDLATGRVTGSELLLRPQRGSLTNWMANAPLSIRDEVAVWALELAARELRQRDGIVHMNITPSDLSRAGFVADLQRFVPEHLRRRLVLEVTEEEELRPSPGMLASIGAVRRLGVSFAVDDFAEGWANISSIRILQPAVIKVSWAVVGPGSGSPELAEWLVTLASKLGARTVLEQIESEASAAWARSVGFDLGQGFLWPALLPA